ncbi:MAG: LysM peptidoglycan-binding domain-containing protein, partial [bacterium]|nr:LysM peptidoglycan-binding domain-containing protein [bacterium]
KSTAAQTVTTKPVPGPAKPGNGITLSPSTTTASKEKATSDIETKAAVDLPVSSGKPPVNGKTGTGKAGVKKDGVSKPNYRSIFDATLYNLEVSPRRSDRQAVVKVTLNETLGHYADWLGTSVRRLRRLNSGRRSIRVNQKIRIPLKGTGSLEQFNAGRLEYHMALEEDFYTSYKVVETKERLVNYGDTLWSICNRDEEIPIWLLKKYNRNINLDALKVNMLITVPVIAAVE